MRMRGPPVDAVRRDCVLMYSRRSGVCRRTVEKEVTEREMHFCENGVISDSKSGCEHLN